MKVSVARTCPVHRPVINIFILILFQLILVDDLTFQGVCDLHPHRDHIAFSSDVPTWESARTRHWKVCSLLPLLLADFDLLAPVLRPN